MYVYLSREDVSLSITAYQVTALPWPALWGLCCHTQEIWCQAQNPSVAKNIRSSLASTWAWCERLVGISIHTKDWLIIIPFNSLVVTPWSRERLFWATIFTELCRLSGLQKKVWSTLLTYFLFLWITALSEQQVCSSGMEVRFLSHIVCSHVPLIKRCWHAWQTERMCCVCVGAPQSLLIQLMCN